MRKWDHLIEADVRLRELERNYENEPTTANAATYVAALKRSVSRTDMRFDRLVDEFLKTPSERTLGEVTRDIRRLEGAPDRELSTTCMLRGQMGRVCKQTKQKQVTTKYFIILVSYTTPVAYKVRETGAEFYTDTKYSITTTKQIRRWTDNQATPVPQKELDELYKAAV